MWSRREEMGGWMFILFVFIIGVTCVAIPYFASNNIAASYLGTVWDPEIAFDRDFPVINWTIIPYAALYLFYPFTLLLAPRDDRGRMELALGIQGLFLVTMFCVLFFLILPAEIDLRDQLDTHWESNPPNWLEDALFTFIHASDNPWNAWPSLHIVHSYLLARLMTFWVIREYPESKAASFFLVILWIEWVLLCLSILATKQHYLFDLITGALVGVTCWRLFQPLMDMVERRGPSEMAIEFGWQN
jgi:membrane-associated phospholipid phosphatase|tara:strand:+ start:1505 stop:2239 length:735 start_codon:yes stop_codon:yes gene_type:complete